MPLSYPPPGDPWGPPIAGSGAYPFYFNGRDYYTRPFGTNTTKKAGERIIKFCKVVGDEYSLDPKARIGTYAGGDRISLFAADDENYDTYINLKNNEDTATRDIGGNNQFIVTSGIFEYTYDDPSGTGGYGMLQSVKNTVTDAVIDYYYINETQGHADYWKLQYIKEDTTTLVEVHWHTGNDYIESIDFKNYHNGTHKTIEEFVYENDGQLKGINEKYYDNSTTTTVRAIRWTLDIGNGPNDTQMIEELTVLDPTNLNNTLYTTTYHWGRDSNDVIRLEDYERFGEVYDVVYDTNTVTTIHPPQPTPTATPVNGKTVKTVSSAGGVQTNTFEIKDENSAVLYKETGKHDETYNVLVESFLGSDSPTYHRYGFDKGSPPATLLEKLLPWQVEYPEGNYDEYTYSGTNLTRIGKHDQSTNEDAYIQIDYTGDLVTKVYTDDGVTRFWEVELHYDGEDRVDWIEDGENRRTTLTYDSTTGQVETITNNSLTTTMGYDSVGYLDTIETPEGIVTAYDFDPKTRNLLSVTLDDNGYDESTTSYAYTYSNLGPDLTSVIDGESRKTGYEYDVYGRLTDEVLYTGAGSYTEVARADYTYDADIGDRLTKKEDFKDTDIDYTYYDSGRLKEVSWTPESAGEWGSVTYTYNTAGRVTNIAPSGGDLDCSCTIDLFYDDNGANTGHDSIHDGYPVLYGYDDIGRFDQLLIPVTSGAGYVNTISYDHDVASRVTEVVSSLHNDVEFDYNKANQIANILFDSSSFDADVDYTFNSNTGRLESIDFTPDGTARGLDYFYNNDGLITGITHVEGGSSYPVRYGYDGQNRLSWEAGQSLFTSSQPCIRLDGSQTITLENGGAIENAQTAFGVQARVFLEEYPASEAIIFERGDLGNADWFKLSITSAGYLRIDVETDDRDKDAQMNYALPLNQWMHLAATWDDTSERIRLYFNNYKVAESSKLEGELQAFSGSESIGTGLIGRIDALHVRDDTTITPDLENPTNVANSTLGLWNFGEGSGTTSDDEGADDIDATTVPSGGWSNAQNEGKPAIYLIKYEYDKVGNRTVALKFWRDSTPTAERWTYTYNDLNQLTQRNQMAAIYGSGATFKWVYTYDANGNMTQVSKQTGASVQTELWLYTWNPRDQLTKVEKRTGTGAGTYAGKVEYAYCLSCDGALARRKEYDTVTSTKLVSDKRYEYDGLKLLRVDERCDADNDGEIEAGETTWRTVEANTYGPGIVGNLLAKRVYSYPTSGGGYCTSNGSTDYYYAYDHVGNVHLIFDDDGNEVYHFNQDAFGNELNFGNYTGSDWETAADNGISEHQTGKWIDDFSGLYFFSARWYDSQLARFVSRDPRRETGGDIYGISANNPIKWMDPTGRWRCWGPGCTPPPDFGGNICCDGCASAVGGAVTGGRAGEQTDNRNGDNALRHCVASCLAAQLCGADCSESFYNGRETDQYPLSPSNRMDIHNNNQGRACASGSCGSCCLQKMRDGDLACLDSRGRPVRCGH